MNLDQLINQFRVFAEAPGGVDRIRELVLELAFHGKFADHRTSNKENDTLVRIARQRSELGTLSMRPTIEGPFSIPESWVWVSLRDVGEIVGGSTPSTQTTGNFSDTGYPWLTPADVRKYKQGKVICRGDRFLTESGLADCRARLMPPGAVVFSSRAPIGYVAIAGCRLCTNQGFKSIVPHLGEMSNFIYWYLVYASTRINALAPGTTFKEVSGAFMAAYPIPVPSLTHQLQTVNRVEAIWALCDQLEAAMASREEVAEKMSKAIAVNVRSVLLGGRSEPPNQG